MGSTIVHHNAAVPAHDFGDTRAEFAALLSASGVYDLGRAKISLTGGDRMRWLNGMITNNVRDLPPERGIYAFLLNPQGHILGDLYAYNRGESLVLDTDRSQLEKLLATFDHYIIMDDVAVSNQSDQLASVGIAGPGTRELLRRAEIGVPGLEVLQFVAISWQSHPLVVVRSDNPLVESYELWLAPESVSLMMDTLVKAGARPVGAVALNLLRIASGTPRFGQDIRERDLPQETGQERALHFSKGCYIGQEIVERIRSRGSVHRMFTGFAVHSTLPEPGRKLQAEGKDVGEITSSAVLPGTDRDAPVALGYIRRELAIPGKEVQAGESRLSVAKLPFTQFLGVSPS